MSKHSQITCEFEKMWKEAFIVLLIYTFGLKKKCNGWATWYWTRTITIHQWTANKDYRNTLAFAKRDWSKPWMFTQDIRCKNETEARTSRIQRRNANYKSILFGEIKGIKVHYYITKTNTNYHYYLCTETELFSPCMYWVNIQMTLLNIVIRSKHKLSCIVYNYQF